MISGPKLIDFHKPYVEVHCTRCERRGRYALSRLIAKYGAEFTFLELRSELEATCVEDLPMHQVCGINFPGLVELAKLAHAEKAAPK